MPEVFLKYLLIPIKQYVQLAYFRWKWKKRNKHNDTMPNNVFPIDKVSVGKGTYAVLNVYSYRNPQECLKIGNYCSIASDVIFVLSGEHRSDGISTYPFGEKVLHIPGETALCKGPIIIEDDVWIGTRVTVLSGVRIGRGSIIAANSIVVKDVAAYSVYVGNKVVRKRFPDDIAVKISDVDFTSLNEGVLRQIYDKKVTVQNIEDILKIINNKEN